MALISKNTELITVAAVAVGFTADQYDETSAPGTILAKCVVEDAPIRINTAATPTAGGAEGSPIKYPGEHFEVSGIRDLKSFLAIRTGSVSGKLNVIFLGSLV